MSAIPTFQVSQDFNQSSVSPTAIDTYTQECDQNVYLPILPTLFNQPQPQPQYYPENYLIHSFTTPQHLYYIQDCPFVEHNQPPLKNISIYASYIFANISNDYIHHVFSTIGAVKRIDIIDKINTTTGQPFKSAFVHFYFWYPNHVSFKIQQELLTSTNSRATICYSGSHYWVLYQNTHIVYTPTENFIYQFTPYDAFVLDNVDSQLHDYYEPIVSQEIEDENDFIQQNIQSLDEQDLNNIDEYYNTHSSPSHSNDTDIQRIITDEEYNQMAEMWNLSKLTHIQANSNSDVMFNEYHPETIFFYHPHPTTPYNQQLVF